MPGPLVFATGVRARLCARSGRVVPLSERFFAGGSASMRGFGQNASAPSARIAFTSAARRCSSQQRTAISAILPRRRRRFADIGNVFALGAHFCYAISASPPASGSACARPGSCCAPTTACAGPASRRAAKPHLLQHRPGVLTRGMALTPRATYRLQLAAGFGFDDAAAVAAVPRRARHQPPLLLAVPAGGAGQHARLRRRRPRRGSTRSWAATRGTHRLCATPGRARPGPGARHRAQPHGDHRRENAGGGTCWRTARRAATPPTSTSTGIRPRPSCATRCCCPILGDHYGRVLEAGELQLVERRRRRVRDPLPRARDAGRARARSTTCCAAAGRGAAARRRAGVPRRRLRRPAAVDRDRPRQRRSAGIATRRSSRASSRGSAAGAPRAGRGDRRRGRRDQRRPRPPRRPARAPELPAGLLAHRRPGARLPPLLRHQHAGRPAHRGRAGLRGHPRARARAGCADGVLDGLRIDHPDGLRDPRRTSSGCATHGPGARGSSSRRSSSPASSCRPTGRSPARPATTSSNRVDGLFVDPAGEARADRALRGFTGATADYAAMVARDEAPWSCSELLGSDLNRLTELLVATSASASGGTATTPAASCATRSREVIACFPVYRTYVRAATATVTRRRTARYIDGGDRGGRATGGPTSTRDLFDFLRDAAPARASAATLEAELVMRFQQLTGPVMAKGVEDTAFYRYNRLVALNEVGGDPGRFGVSLDEFHAACSEAAAALAARDARHVDPRHQAQRGRAGADALLSEMPERVGARRAALARAERAAPAATAARPQRRVPALPDAGRRLADRPRSGSWRTWRRRSARPRRTPPGRDPDAATRRRSRAFVDGVLADAEFVARPRGVRRPAGRAGAGQLAGARCC